MERDDRGGGGAMWQWTVRVARVGGDAVYVWVEWLVGQSMWGDKWGAVSSVETGEYPPEKVV